MPLGFVVGSGGIGNIGFFKVGIIVHQSAGCY